MGIKKQAGKMITLINKSTETVTRVNKEIAYYLLLEGGFEMTSKSKLKSFLNQQGKLIRNKKRLKDVNFDALIKPDRVYRMVKDGKAYGLIHHLPIRARGTVASAADVNTNGQVFIISYPKIRRN